jgi:hypothetical protein
MAVVAALIAEDPHIDLEDCRLPSLQSETLLGKGQAERLRWPSDRADFQQSMVSIHGP